MDARWGVRAGLSAPSSGLGVAGGAGEVGCRAPTLADLFVFCALRRGPLHAGQDLAELAPLSHLVRWFDYVQGSPVGAATREEGEEPRVRVCAFLSCLVVSPRW